MGATVQKELVLEGLCCANCASKIESEISNLEEVHTASVDFMSKTLSMDIKDSVNMDRLMEKTCSIIKKHEPDITIKAKEITVPGQKTLYLDGLHCADCANKIEQAVKKLPGVRAVSLDFLTQKLVIGAKDQHELPALAREAGEIAVQIEPGIRISYTGKQAEHQSGKKREWLERGKLLAGAAIFAAGMLLSLDSRVELAAYLVSYLLVGGDVLWKAVKNIFRGRVFDENFLMSVATVGAFAIGEYPEGVAVMLFYQVGELFQNLAVNRSRKSIVTLMDIRPDFANLRLESGIRTVSPEEVGIGDFIVVKPGEKVPLDGTVREGSSALDTSALTGESLPRNVEPGSSVLSGSINQSGLLTIEVTKEFGESTVSKILDLVQNSAGKKAPTENFITKFAKYYTPVVVFAALGLALLPPLLIPGATFSEWIHRALVFLVVSCPCALVISIPLSFFGGIGGASRHGILIKGSNYLEALNRVDTVVFDKTGTLTKGTFRVTNVVPAAGFTEEELLELAAYAEYGSNHPIAKSILEAYGSEIDQSKISEIEEISGQGMRAKIEGKAVLAGNGRLLSSADISFSPAQNIGTVVYLAADGKFAGHIVIADEVKSDSRQTIGGLKSLGIRRTVMLTGDSKAVGEAVASELGLDEVYTELLPQQKVEILERLEQNKPGSGKLLFMGDGINDAPVLARADVGIAMGGVGSDAAIEAADAVLMTDEPSRLVTAIRIAKKTRKIVWQNIIFALSVKGIILILGAFGWATMWEAVFGDVGVAVIAIFNAMRAMYLKEKQPSQRI